MSNILDIEKLEKCIKSLSNKRRIFHSEADFQFALAWEIKENYKDDVNIRLEYPVDKMNIDIVVFCGEKMIPIELKWLRTDFECCIKGADGENGEKFKLALSGADPEIRYDCLKDIKRIESISEIRDNFVEGYTIWISNIETHFNKNHKHTMQFDISQDETQKGKIYWDKNEQDEIKNIDGTLKKSLREGDSRRNVIELKDSYTFHWEDYSIIDKSEIDDKKYHKQNKFKYCITTIKKPS